MPTNPHASTMIGKFLKRYVVLSNRLVKAYERKFGFICDVYFPINNSGANQYGTFEVVDIFNRIQSSEYKSEPNADIIGVKFIIVNIFK